MRLGTKIIAEPINPAFFVLLFTCLAAFFRWFRLSDFPPAMYLDEAWDAYDAVRILRDNAFPIFFGGSFGREPLMIYLQAFGFFLWGTSSWTLRLVPSLVGVLTIPVIYRTTADIFGATLRAKWLGALASGMLAISFWHVEVSRLSFRVIFVPLASLLATWAFWRGMSTCRIRYYLIAGILIGISLYTYPATRLIPVTLAGFMIIIAVQSYYKRESLRNVLPGTAIMLTSMAIVFAPLAVYYLNHPGAFYVRASTTSILSASPVDSLVNLADNLVAVTRMFIDRGDLNARHNLPGLAAINVLGILGFWFGLVIALRRFKSKAVYLLLLIWLGINILPTLLTEQAPHYLRAINVLPAMVILAAVGLMQIRDRWTPKISETILLLVVAVFGGVLTFHEYFNLWGPSRETFEEFEGSPGTLVDHIMTLSQSMDVLIPMNLYVIPQMQFALSLRYPQNVVVLSTPPALVNRMVTGPVQRTNVVIGPTGVFFTEPLSDIQFADLKAQVKTGQAIQNKFGNRVGTDAHLDNGIEFVNDIQPQILSHTDFGGGMQLFGYGLKPQSTIAPGERIRYTLYWRTEQDLNSDYQVFAILYDPNGNSLWQRLSQPVGGESATSLWRHGILVPDDFEVRIPADAHDGKYRLEISVFDRQTEDRPLELKDGGTSLSLEPFTIIHTPVDLTAITHPLDLQVGRPAIANLLGYDLDRTAFTAGEQINLELYWRANQNIATDYSIFVHFLSPDGTILAQQDGQPQNANAPTSWWRAGDVIDDPHTLIVPVNLTPGNYTLAIGIYTPADGIRLPIVSQPNSVISDHWEIPIQISPR